MAVAEAQGRRVLLGLDLPPLGERVVPDEEVLRMLRAREQLRGLGDDLRGSRTSGRLKVAGLP